MLASVLLAIGAVALAWPRAGGERARPLQRPGLLHLEHIGDGGRLADLSAVGGRIRAMQRAEAVFAWLPDAIALQVEDPQGTVELLLGDRNQTWCSLIVLPEHLRLRTGHAKRIGQNTLWDRPPARTFSLRWTAERIQVLADGEPLGDALPAEAPHGKPRIGLWKQSSVSAFSVTTPEGETRRVTPEIEPAGWPRTLWAGISALLGTACLGAWWSLRPRRSPAPTHGREEVTPEPKASDRARAHTLGREPGASATRRAGPAAWSLAGLCMAVVLHGALSHLATHNHERLTAPVTGCATQPLAVAGPIVLRPGQPFDTSPRRDGDFVLQGSLQLEPDSLLDVLFRAEPATRDRGLIAGLSTCAEVPCDTVLNLGTALSRRPGPGPLRADEPHALSIVCRGARSVVSVDGTELGTLSSYDLRAGRIALHALRGGATLRDLSIVPAEVPVDTGPVLRRWLMLVGGSLLGGSLLLLLLARGSPAAWIWLLPLAVALAPAAPRAALTPGLLLAALLLLATPALRPGRLAWAPAWALGAGMLCVASWAVTEAPPEFSPNLLSRLDLTDVTGGSLPARQLWARHPLTRKFNGWLRDQTLRGQPVSQTPFPGVPRVIALGSSSTYGYGVEADQAWPAQLADLLSGHGRPVEVLNAGVPNGTARRLLPFLRDALLDLSPDLVIVSLSFNDHIELALNHERDHFDAMTGAGVGWFDQQLARWSRRQARRRWQDYFGQVLHGESPDAELTGRCVLEPARRFEQTLEEMAAAAAARGVALVLMKEPPRDPLQPGLIGVYHAAMDALGQRLGLPVADPKPTLDAAGGELFLDAIHPNPRGHAIVAEVLARTVREARMLGR